MLTSWFFVSAVALIWLVITVYVCFWGKKFSKPALFFSLLGLGILGAVTFGLALNAYMDIYVTLYDLWQTISTVW